MIIQMEPIGYLRSNIKSTKEAPRFHTMSEEEGVIEIHPYLADGLFLLEERTHLAVLFCFNQRAGENQIIKDKKQFPKMSEHIWNLCPLHQTPPRSGISKGVFSTCSNNRPNPIGLDIVELIKVEGNKIYIKKIDMIDGTPILDIKPYISSV